MYMLHVHVRALSLAPWMSIHLRTCASKRKYKSLLKCEVMKRDQRQKKGKRKNATRETKSCAGDWSSIFKVQREKLKMLRNTIDA